MPGFMDVWQLFSFSWLLFGCGQIPSNRKLFPLQPEIGGGGIGRSLEYGIDFLFCGRRCWSIRDLAGAAWPNLVWGSFWRPSFFQLSIFCFGSGPICRIKELFT